jgi:hypothetical protein
VLLGSVAKMILPTLKSIHGGHTKEMKNQDQSLEFGIVVEESAAKREKVDEIKRDFVVSGTVRDVYLLTASLWFRTMVTQ